MGHSKEHSSLKLIYKMFYNDSPPCMTAHIPKLQFPYNLRNSLKLKSRLTLIQNSKKSSVSCRGTTLWNLLPIECRMANSANSFRQMIINLWSGQEPMGSWSGALTLRYKAEDNSTAIGIPFQSHNVNNLENYY